MFEFKANTFVQNGAEKDQGDWGKDDLIDIKIIKENHPELSEWGALAIGSAWGDYSQDVYLVNWLRWATNSSKRDNEFLSYCYYRQVYGNWTFDINIDIEKLENLIPEWITLKKPNEQIISLFKQYETWLGDSVDDELIPPKFINMDLSYTDLSNVQFAHAYIENVDFTGCLLNKTDFNKAEIRRCNFSRIKADCANFSDVKVSRSLFTYSHLENISFDHSIITKTNFDFAIVEYCVFYNTKFKKSSFKLNKNQDEPLGSFEWSYWDEYSINNSFLRKYPDLLKKLPKKYRVKCKKEARNYHLELAELLFGVVSKEYKWASVPENGYQIEFILCPDGNIELDYLNPTTGVFWSETTNEEIKQPFKDNNKPLTWQDLVKVDIPFMT